MVVPGRVGREVRRTSVSVNRDAIVPEQRMTKADQRMQHVIFFAVREHLSQMKGRLPRVAFEIELGEMAMRVERFVASLRGLVEQFDQQWKRTL